MNKSAAGIKMVECVYYCIYISSGISRNLNLVVGGFHFCGLQRALPCVAVQEEVFGDVSDWAGGKSDFGLSCEPKILKQLVHRLRLGG